MISNVIIFKLNDHKNATILASNQHETGLKFAEIQFEIGKRQICFCEKNQRLLSWGWPRANKQVVRRFLSGNFGQR